VKPGDHHTPEVATPTTPPVAREKQLAFSFNASLLAGSEDTADGFAALFRELYLALDERQMSYLQGTLQLLLRDETAQKIQEKLAELGISSTVKDL
jgi:hypothetical protein